MISPRLATERLSKVATAKVSGIAMDVMLFSQHGARLVHRYRVYGGNLPHQSLRVSFMAKLSGLTHLGLCRCPLSGQMWPRFLFRVYTYSCTSRTDTSHTGLCPSGPEVCTRHTHSHVGCRSLSWCSRFDRRSAPSSDPRRPCPDGACCWPGASGPADANLAGFPAATCLSCRPLVRHRLLPSRQLTSWLLGILLLCLGPARRLPPMSCSRLTLMFRCPRRGVLLHLSWPVLSRSICQYHRSRDFHRSCCRWIGFGRILMWPRRTCIPCLMRLSIAPVLVRQPRRRCQSPTGPLSSRSCHSRLLLFRRWSSSTRIPPCWFSSPWLIGSGSPSLRRIMCPSCLHLCSVRGLLLLRPALKPRLIILLSCHNWTDVPPDSRSTGIMNTPMWIPRLVCRFTTHDSWSGWGRWSLPAGSAGHPVSGSGSCPGSRPCTLHSSSNETLTSWPPTLAFCSSTPLACTVWRRIFSSRSSDGIFSPACSSSASDPVQHGSLPAGSARHGLSGVAPPASAGSCAHLASISVPWGAFCCCVLLWSHDWSSSDRATTGRMSQPTHVVPGLRIRQCGYPVWFAGSPPTILGVGGGAGVCPVSGSVSCPGSRPCMLCSSSNETLTAWPPTLAFCSSTPLACAVRRRIFSSRSSDGIFSPSTAVHDASPVPHVRRASDHMTAMGLWRPPNGPDGPWLEFFHQGPQCSGCPTCLPRPSGW